MTAKTQCSTDTTVRRFYIQSIDPCHRETLTIVARKEGAEIAATNIWGILLECDEQTLNRVVAIAGEIVCEFEELRLQALTAVLEQHGYWSFGDRDPHLPVAMEDDEVGFAHIFPVDRDA